MAWDRSTRQALPSAEVTHLHLLRHGQADTGGQRLAYGHLDLPLSAEGKRQGEELLRWAPDGLPPADGIWSSDLRRCAELAEALAGRLGLPLQVTAELREQHMGEWEGVPWSQLTERDIGAVRAWWTDYARARPPGGESWLETASRVRGWWEGRQAELRGGRWIVVAHIGAIRALVCQGLGLPDDQALRLTPLPGSHSWLQVAEAGGVLQCLGERPFSGAAGVAAERSGKREERAGSRQIALAGSAGTGKTTLGRALAQELDLPYIPEGMRERIEAGLDVHALGHHGLRALILELWAEQGEAEARCRSAAGGFVSDRSPLDYAAFWLAYGYAEDAAATERFFAEVRQRLGDIDRLLILPWGVLPIVADGVRTPNPWIQRHFQGLLEGLATREASPDRLRWMPGLVERQARLAWAVDAVREAGRG